MCRKPVCSRSPCRIIENVPTTGSVVPAALIYLAAIAPPGPMIQWANHDVQEERSGYTIECGVASPNARAVYEPLFQSEWCRYPTSFLQKVGVQRVVIGTRLTVLGERRAAFADEPTMTLWLDADTGARIPNYGRQVLHHDLFHLVDATDPKRSDWEAKWRSLNRPDFAYGKGGWFMRGSNATVLRSDLPGFLTEYSTSALSEDRAEVFGHLMASSAFVSRQTRRDPVIAAKVRTIRIQIADMDPKMGPNWWR